MTSSVTVSFTRDEWLPVTRDGLDYQVYYSFVPSRLVGEPDESHETKTGTVRVGISRTLGSMWGLAGEPLRRVLFEYAKRHVRAKAEEAALGGASEIQLTSATAPPTCPFDPERVRLSLNQPLEFQTPARNPMAAAAPSALPSQIIDLRDSINATFGEVFGGRLLSLPQERNVVELFKRCDDHESFAYRVASIGGLAIAIEPAALRKHVAGKGAMKGKPESKATAKATPEPTKPIDLLGSFLRAHSPADRVDPIMDAIKSFNNLRRMYPIHTDRAEGVLSAHRFFGIDYPVKDHSDAGTRLLEIYRDTLERLLTLLKASSVSSQEVPSNPALQRTAARRGRKSKGRGRRGGGH